jgi:hypothetical protein
MTRPMAARGAVTAAKSASLVPPGSRAARSAVSGSIRSKISARQAFMPLSRRPYRLALASRPMAGQATPALKAMPTSRKQSDRCPAHIVLPWVHRVFSNLKRWALGVYHGLRKKHLQTYLDEFVFRFNRRKNRAAGFVTLLRNALQLPALTYIMLIEPEPAG